MNITAHSNARTVSGDFLHAIYRYEVEAGQLSEWLLEAVKDADLTEEPFSLTDEEAEEAREIARQFEELSKRLARLYSTVNTDVLGTERK